MSKIKSYYFSHDYQARNDQRLIYLRKKLGAQAIGIYWMLIEVLHENDNCYQLLSIVQQEMTALDFGISIPELTKILDVMTELELINITADKKISSKRVGDNLLKQKDISEKRRQARSNVNKSNQLITIVEKEKKRKEKKIKEDKNININTNTDAREARSIPLIEAEPLPKNPKLNFGEEGKVLLTAEEHDKLINKYGAETTKSCITLLNDFLGAKKKDPYASHYHAIKKWVVEAVEAKKGIPKNSTNGIKPTSAMMNSMASDLLASQFLEKGD